MNTLLFCHKYMFLPARHICPMQEALSWQIVKRSFRRYNSFWIIQSTLLCPPGEGAFSKSVSSLKLSLILLSSLFFHCNVFIGKIYMLLVSIKYLGFSYYCVIYYSHMY